MKKSLVFVFASLIIVSCMGQKKSNKKNEKLPQNFELKSFKDSVSFAIGCDIAESFSSNKMDINYDALIAGINDTYIGKEKRISKEEAQKIMMRFQIEMQAKQQAESNKESAANKEKGKTYMSENIKKEGVKQTTSGLQYKVIREGNGAKPLASNTVKVHYEGKLLDGTIFDSSYGRGEPIEFGLNQVIKGWTEGLQLMNVGSVYELTIPSELGYGDRSMQAIPAGSTLIFKVELLDFK